MGEVLPENKAHSPALETSGFIAYYNNEGKRQAVRDLTAFILALDAPCLIRVFTDESLDWVYEDSAFTRELAGYVGQVVQKGCRIQRVRPPDLSTESVFRSMERWLPAYMAGVLKIFITLDARRLAPSDNGDHTGAYCDAFRFLGRAKGMPYDGSYNGHQNGSAYG